MTISRRAFLGYAQAAGLFYAGLATTACAQSRSANAGLELLPDPEGLLDLPSGFSYRVVSETGGMMSDGFLRPGRPDGMACFADPDDANKCILMRNHENWLDTADGSPFGEDNALLSRLDADLLYDSKADGPFFGGVTKVVYDLQTNQLERDFIVLTGTTANCAGGATPWGSWLSCEELMVRPGESGAGKYHGFVFETPASASSAIAPVPLTAMGRFAHEAAAVDPATGIIYLTEDNRTGLFYRFIPDTPGRLEQGGRLQALVITGQPSANTSNWSTDWGGPGLGIIAQGDEFAVEWIDMDDVESPNADLAQRGHAAGAAQFCRGEGMEFGLRPGSTAGEVYFNCTQGGVQRTGQVWSYRPSANEGQSTEIETPGMLTLLYESPGADTLDTNDNLAIAPWGDLILCEDGPGDQYLRGLTPAGQIYDLARNAHADKSEFCGACFSPDGSVMFVNIQVPGITLAITGPWSSIRA